MTYKIEGIAELEKKLKELANPREQLNTLRGAVRSSMKAVMAKAQANIAAISPGAAQTHRTYRGRLVSAGFASRSLRVVVKANKRKTAVSALLGVRAEAFYALQFFELGTSKIPRAPWLVPAFEASRETAVRAVATELKKRIERIAKKRAAGK